MMPSLEELQPYLQDAAAVQAAEHFCRLGLPTQRHEDWKYTDIRRLTAALGRQWWQPSQPSQPLNRQAIDGLDAYCLLWHQGVYQAEFSDCPEGVQVYSQSQASCVRNIDAASSSVQALNAAMSSDGVQLRIADGVVLDKPLCLIYVADAGMSYMRHSVHVGKSAQCQLIEHIEAASMASGLSLATSIVLDDGAHCEHYHVNKAGLGLHLLADTQVEQQANSVYRAHMMGLGGAWSRLDVHVRQLGDAAETYLHGLLLLSGRQHMDIHTRIDHEAKHGLSRESVRGVFDGRSHGVFNGKIIVHEGAVKTDSAQSNGNLLLSSKAEIDTKPDLEIYNDDVKCAHGATVGQLDQNQFFYLRSRGLSAADARQLLVFAFADEVLTNMSVLAVRHFIEQEASMLLLGNQEAIQ